MTDKGTYEDEGAHQVPEVLNDTFTLSQWICLCSKTLPDFYLL